MLLLLVCRCSFNFVILATVYIDIVLNIAVEENQEVANKAQSIAGACCLLKLIEPAGFPLFILEQTWKKPTWVLDLLQPFSIVTKLTV